MERECLICWPFPTFSISFSNTLCPHCLPLWLSGAVRELLFLTCRFWSRQGLREDMPRGVGPQSSPRAPFLLGKERTTDGLDSGQAIGSHRGAGCLQDCCPCETGLSSGTVLPPVSLMPAAAPFLRATSGVESEYALSSGNMPCALHNAGERFRHGGFSLPRCHARPPDTTFCVPCSCPCAEGLHFLFPSSFSLLRFQLTRPLMAL